MLFSTGAPKTTRLSFAATIIPGFLYNLFKNTTSLSQSCFPQKTQVNFFNANTEAERFLRT